MKAAVYDEVGEPEVLRYAEVPDPELHPRGVLVEVRAIGVQGGDTLNRRAGAIPKAPHIVGYQASGVLRAVGGEVDGLHEGQRVVVTVGNGSHAELISAPARSVWPLPDAISFEVAAGVPVEFGTADDCLFEFGHLQAGETVLIQAGAGGVGVAAVQLAKAAGATVIATASSDERLERLRPLGLDHPLNYRDRDVVAEVMRLTDDRGVDLVVDPVGGRTLEGSIAALAYRGRISWVGQAGRDDKVPDVWPLMQKNASLTGVFFGAEMWGRRGDRAHALVARLLERVASGELEVVVDRTFPLAEAAAAHRYIESRAAFGRVLLIP